MRKPPLTTQRKFMGGAKPARKLIKGKAPSKRNRFGPTGLLGRGYLKGPGF